MLRSQPHPSRTTVSALVLALGLAGCGDAPTPSQAPPQTIDWVAAQPPPTAVTRARSGTVAASEQGPLSFAVSGHVAALHVGLGDRFAAGDVLAELDAEPFRLEVAQRRAERERARAELPAIRAQYERDQKLAADNIKSVRELEQSQAQLARARAEIQRAEAALATAKRRLRDATLNAPYDGRVARRPAERGAFVAAGTEVLRAVATDGLEVHVPLAETEVDALTPGSEHRVRFAALPQRTLTGRVIEIAAEAGASGAFEVRLALTDPPSALRPGMSAEVALRLQPDDGGVAQVPLSALAATPDADNRAAVFVYDPQAGALRRHTVRVRVAENQQVTVLEGLQPGEIVARRGVGFLEDGMAVRLVGRGVALRNP
ncbi:efflux RND transporter periplasmic adaptor subunit [Algiphilus sp.]|uniref:efflux RND transporter periplasmic adaptor subunit n=1 Tax=Algiphilus sp. TaxID=1872431 RepID=UPI002A676EEA|nr:efflux RND transporter periplasmic adaptor subunit [Pseudomonadota bacterium]